MTPRRRAFTMLELLIAVGVIFLLASLIIVALGGVRSAANRADSINALRQMTMAYNGYSTDNDQRLMPGYVSAARQAQLGIRAKLATGKTLATPGDAESYVWRLAPYLDHEWRTMFIDYRNKELDGRLNAELGGNLRDQGDGSFAESPPVYGPQSVAFPSDIGISRAPSFGLNSVFVGGDDVHGGVDITDRNPWDNPGNKLAATRYAEVKSPARLIVFAPSSVVDSPITNPLANDVRFGSPELRPPMLDWVRNAGVLEPIDPQWRVGADNEIDTAAGEYDAGGGVPISRWGGSEIPTGHLDGSVSTQAILDLESDLRKWSPFVTGY